MNFTDSIGYIAAVLGSCMALPQLIKVIRTKHARDVSIIMFGVNVVATSLWFVYGLLVNSVPVVAANVVAFIFSVSIIMLKLKYDREKS